MHREQQKAKRMLEERLKITSLEERLKTEMASAGGNLSLLELGGTAEALRQAMQHEDRMRAQHELGGMRGQDMVRMLAMAEGGGRQEGFDSGPASSSGSLPHSPRQLQICQEGSPGYSPGAGGQQALQGPQEQEQPPGDGQETAHYQKEAGGDAVSVYPKDMTDQHPGLVYHKQVGGHSVSIYPKDLASVAPPEPPTRPQEVQAPQAPSPYQGGGGPVYPGQTPAYPGSAYQSGGHHHGMQAQAHATTPSD